MSRLTRFSRVRWLPGIAPGAVAGVIMVVTLVACSAGDRPIPGSTAGVSGAASAPEIAGETGSSATREPPTPSPRPTEIPGPPAVSLAGGLEGPVPGELGTFFWGGLGSDSPWVVPLSAVTAKPGATFIASIDPALAPERWTVSWSPIWNGAAGRITGVAEGAWNPIQIEAPVQPGPWGVLVELHFPSGDRAAFYWRVDVAP